MEKMYETGIQIFFHMMRMDTVSQNSLSDNHFQQQ